MNLSKSSDGIPAMGGMLGESHEILACTKDGEGGAGGKISLWGGTSLSPSLFNSLFPLRKTERKKKGRAREGVRVREGERERERVRGGKGARASERARERERE